MKQISVFILILFLVSSFQNPRYVLYKSISVKASYFTTDNIQNAYIVKDDVIQKYDSTGTLFKTFSNKSFGKITSVDASNPLKLVLFYKDFSQIIFLDNMLSLSGDPVQLSAIGLEQTQLACSSHNSGLWVYDQQNFELIRLDQHLQQIQKTGNLIQLTGFKINPNYLIEYNNKVYLNDPGNGILIFDIYGTYYKNVPVKNLSTFQVKDEKIIYYSNKKINSFDIKTMEEETYDIPDSTAISVRSEKDHLFLLKNNSLDIYVK